MQSETTGAFHLSPQQRLLWESAPSNRSRLLVKVEGRFDAARLRNAVEKLVERHEILRTTYTRMPGVKTPFQVVGDSSNVDVTIGPGEFTIELPAMSADAVSLSNIFHEVVALYSGVELGEVLQYADYSEWQNELPQKAGTEARAAKDFWASHDWAAIPSPMLPFEKKADSGTRTAIAIGPVSADLDELMAAWAVLLRRLSGQLEMVVGRVTDGRTQDEFVKGLGLYARALPQYISFNGTPTLTDVIDAVKSGRAEVEKWADFFQAGGVSSNSKFGFSVASKPAPATAGGVIFSPIAAEVYSPFSLELRSDGMGGGELIFDGARFSPKLIERMGRMLAILTAADPSVPVSNLPIMDANEEQQTLVAFNETTFAFPRDKSLHRLFEEQAAETPDLPALRDEKVAFTYAELNAAANRLAHTLSARGVRANVPVGLLMERSSATIVGMLGILKAGGCYLPLLPDHPKARLLHQLSETGASIVVSDEKCAGLLPDFAGATIRFDGNGDASSENPQANAGPEDLIYVMYTSGSTGTPKGVAVRHRNVVNYSSFIQSRVGGRGLNFATVSTLAADLGNTCIFPALISGGCVHVIGYETAMSGELFAKYSAAHALDILKITPSHLKTLLDAAGASVLPRRFLISGGEALSWSLYRTIQETGCKVINHYGPTETTIGCCIFDGERNVSEWEPATVPIGKPIGNAEVYILDGSQSLPLGVAGELCVGGEGVAQGYFDQPVETARVFVQNPFGKPGELIYRTGDLARFLPTGDVEFLGRIDQQIKIRGFRVEPAEVEAAVRRHPAVRQAVIAAEQDASAEKILVAYVAANKRIEMAEWRSFLRDYLPDYMFPARVVTIDALPLTPNGKIDFRSLAALRLSEEAAGQQSMTAPRNATEEKVAAIWREVLRTDRVGINDNFFEMGGHSLLATQIIARIRNGFCVQFPLHSFLESPTIAMVCAKLDSYPKIESEEDTMARLMQEIEGLSEEEAEMLLKTMESGDDAGEAS